MKINIPTFVDKSREQLKKHWDSLFNYKPQDVIGYSFMQTRLNDLLKRYEDLDRSLKYRSDNLVNHVLEVYDESLHEKIIDTDRATYNCEYGSAKWHYLQGMLAGLKYTESAIKQQEV